MLAASLPIKLSVIEARYERTDGNNFHKGGLDVCLRGKMINFIYGNWWNFYLKLFCAFFNFFFFFQFNEIRNKNFFFNFVTEIVKIPIVVMASLEIIITDL